VLLADGAAEGLAEPRRQHGKADGGLLGCLAAAVPPPPTPRLAAITAMGGSQTPLRPPARLPRAPAAAAVRVLPQRSCPGGPSLRCARRAGAAAGRVGCPRGAGSPAQGAAGRGLRRARRRRLWWLCYTSRVAAPWLAELLCCWCRPSIYSLLARPFSDT
jgi:hypothetical protein